MLIAYRSSRYEIDDCLSRRDEISWIAINTHKYNYNIIHLYQLKYRIYISLF